MPPVIETPAPHTCDVVPTTALYRVPVADETQVEQLPGADAPVVIWPLDRELTETTLHEPLAVFVTASTVRLSAFLSGVGLLGRPAVFEPTPFTIARPHVAGTPVIVDRLAGAPPAYRAFKDLARWLDAEDAQVAEMVKIGRTTAYTWNRDGREPRPATAQRIYEHHATLDALGRRLGTDGLRSWLHEGVPPRRDALLNGRLASLESDVHAVLFRQSAERRIDLSAAPEEIGPVVERTEAEPKPVRSSGRRPRQPGP